MASSGTDKTPSSKLDHLHARLAHALAGISDLLPRECKLTLVARHVARPDAQIIVTEDDRVAVIKALVRPVAEVRGYGRPLPPAPVTT